MLSKNTYVIKCIRSYIQIDNRMFLTSRSVNTELHQMLTEMLMMLFDYVLEYPKLKNVYMFNCHRSFLSQLLCACASMQEDLKTTQSARDREAKQMAQLERTRQRNPSDRQIIVSLTCLSNSINIQKRFHVIAKHCLHLNTGRISFLVVAFN